MVESKQACQRSGRGFLVPNQKQNAKDAHMCDVHNVLVVTEIALS